MAKLSVIMPFVNEFPQVVFTIRSIAEELRGQDFEIIAINNYCQEVKGQNRPEDKGGEYLKNSMPGNPWLKVLDYQDKLSHWQAKNLGVQKSQGDFLFFADAHVVPGRDAIRNAFKYYHLRHEDLHGTIHLPLTYQILEWRKLIYALVADPNTGAFHYRFCSYRDATEPYEVPCMSTCGMMITRELFDKLGGWPTELGIYGGGENFINFSLAVMGYKKWIMPGEPLYHFGEKRGYNWNSSDYLRNRAIATFVSGGKMMLQRMLENARGHLAIKRRIGEEVPVKCAGHRDLVKKQTVIHLGDWATEWEEKS